MQVERSMRRSAWDDNPADTAGREQAGGWCMPAEGTWDIVSEEEASRCQAVPADSLVTASPAWRRAAANPHSRADTDAQSHGMCRGGHTPRFPAGKRDGVKP